MSNFRSAVSDLIITAVATRSDPEEVTACAQAVLEELLTANDQDYLPTLRRLADGVLLAPLAGAGVLARTGAAIVEAGGPPGVLLAAVAERLEEALDAAQGFIRTCQELAGLQRSPGQAIAEQGENVTRTQPRRAVAWNALEPLGLALLVLLRDEACRERVRERDALRSRLRSFRDVHDRAAEVLAHLEPDALR